MRNNFRGVGELGRGRRVQPLLGPLRYSVPQDEKMGRHLYELEKALSQSIRASLSYVPWLKKKIIKKLASAY